MVANASDKKTLKLGNWQIFIVGKLHELYLKREQCNVTLAFEDGQTIQAHKLVLSACSSYFEKLPNVAKTVLLKMPPSMNYRHVRPIVDFMYTGKLEYTLSEQQAVYNAAKNLSMVVLTELLMTQKKEVLTKKEAALKETKFIKQFVSKHTPSSLVGVTVGQPAPNQFSAATPTPPTPSSTSAHPISIASSALEMLPGKKLPFWKKRTATITLPGEFYQNPKPPKLIPIKEEEKPRPTRFELPEDELPDIDISSSVAMDTAFENLSYASEMTARPVVTYPRPVVCEDSITRMPDSTVIHHSLKRTSEVVRGLSDDEDDYDDGHFESIHDLEDDREDRPVTPPPAYPTSTPPKPILKTLSSPSPSKKVRFAFSSENSNTPQTPQTTPSVDGNNVTQSVALPSATSTPINTSKIVTEILKKYPDLVKSNKSIKLKIKSGGSCGSSNQVITLNKDKPDSKVQYVVLKSDLNTKKDEKSEMVMGAENRTGPWFCVSCGDNKGPMTFETYFLYRRHLQDVHNERIDARICEHCGNKSSKRNLHLYHLYTKHNIPPPRNIHFPKCDQCDYIALSESLLIKHRNNHTGMATSEYVCRICNAAFKSNGALMGHMQTNLHQHDQAAKKDYKCPYCGKIFNRNINLKAHIRTSHHLETIRKMYEDEDRVRDPDEGDATIPGEGSSVLQNSVQVQGNQNLLEVVPIYNSTHGNGKTIYLPQGVTLLTDQPNISLMPSSESEALSNVATGIATSIKITDRSIPNDVIVIDDQSELILQGTPAYIQNQDGTFSSLQEYIVPEIMGDTSNRVFTTTLVSSAPATGITYVNSDNIPIVMSSDHTYADGLKINGHVNTGAQVSLVANSSPTVISSSIVSSQANQPIIMNADWLQTIATSQSQGLTLGQGQRVEIISGPVNPVKDVQQKVEIISAPGCSVVSKPSSQPDNSTDAKTLVSDWGDLEEDDNEDEQMSHDNEDESEVKPSRPTIELDSEIESDLPVM